MMRKPGQLAAGMLEVLMAGVSARKYSSVIPQMGAMVERANLRAAKRSRPRSAC